MSEKLQPNMIAFISELIELMERHNASIETDVDHRYEIDDLDIYVGQNTDESTMLSLQNTRAIDGESLRELLTNEK